MGPKTDTYEDDCSKSQYADMDLQEALNNKGKDRKRAVIKNEDPEGMVSPLIQWPSQSDGHTKLTS